MRSPLKPFTLGCLALAASSLLWPCLARDDSDAGRYALKAFSRTDIGKTYARNAAEEGERFILEMPFGEQLMYGLAAARYLGSGSIKTPSVFDGDKMLNLEYDYQKGETRLMFRMGWE